MKKGLVVLVVLALSVPLYAGTINFTATDNTNGTCTIAWTSDVPIVALGLNIDADDPCLADIDSINDPCFFNIYMDLAYDMETDGDPCTNYGYGNGSEDPSNAAANQSAAGQVSLPALSFAISVGGLGGESDPCALIPPPTSGSIVLSGAHGTTGTIGANARRGGVVDDTGAEVTITGDSTWSITVSPECFNSGHADYTEWQDAEAALGVGAVDCWCYKYQCHGDADGLEEGTLKTGYYWVSFADITILANNWQGTSGDTSAAGDYPPDVCADFDRAEEGTLKTGYYRVSFADITILAANWQGTSTDTSTKADDPYVHNCGGEL